MLPLDEVNNFKSTESPEIYGLPGSFGRLSLNSFMSKKENNV